MDFSPTEAQADISGLVRHILTDLVTQDRLRKLEDGSNDGTDRFDPDLWAALGEAGVLSAALPESVGGAGFGLLEQCAVLVELGRAVAPAPYLGSIALGAAALAAFGSDAQRERWAAPAATGRAVLAPALSGEVTAYPDGSGWVLNGTVDVVPAAPVADLFLVSACSSVFLVTPDDAGVTVHRQRVVDLDSAGRLELVDVRIDADRRVGAHTDAADPPGGTGMAGYLAARATLGRCALQLGITERALELTAEYTRTREQFGRPIGAFQAVSQRLADAYLDVEAIRLTLWQAAWRLSTDQPADAELATAAFWAADAGHRVAHTAVHLHGGVGVDVDHPLHRYFTAAKRQEFALGGATRNLVHLGDLLR
jgi:acyl-CoA dehydrogenase